MLDVVRPAPAVVFPAWAGVDPSNSAQARLRRGIPRVGGGRPLLGIPPAALIAYSPRGRG